MDVQNINKSMSYEESSSDDSDSGSSNAEEYSRFREAAVEMVPSSPIFETTRASSNIHATLPPSLRTTSEELNKDEHDLNTTPEFRAHVAKKLTQVLDKSVDMIQTVGVPLRKNSNKQSCRESRESESPGVKLFATSNQAVGAGFASEMPPKRKSKRPPSSSDSDSDAEMARFASAAVSGKDILKQAKETPLWISKAGSDRTETTENKNVGTECVRCEVGNVNGHSYEKGTGDELNVKKKKKKKKKHAGGLEAHIKPDDKLAGKNSTGLEQDVVHLVGNESVADKDTKKIKKECDFENDNGTCSETVDSLKVGVLAGEDVGHKHGAKKKKKQKFDAERSESASCHVYGKKKKCKHRHSEKI